MASFVRAGDRPRMQTPNLETFRLETRAWLEANCPPEMRQPMVDEERCAGGSKFVFFCDAQRTWLRLMAERGWTVPQWPREYGGAGLSYEEAKVLRQEMDRLSCREPLVRIGPSLALIGPTLLKLGTEAQKRQHLPRIANGEARWCQGYSEPRAGSDLASLETRAEDKGDHFLVNGHKIWTSYADKSDWIFLLARTDPEAPKHQGISFLLACMSSPGITTRPIRMISGVSPFCETFFENVRIPKENLVGSLNQGWSVSRTLLTHEREAPGNVFNFTAEQSLGLIAREATQMQGNAELNPMLRAAIAQYEIDAWSFTFACEAAADAAAAQEPLPGAGSLLKFQYAELNQLRNELRMRIGGLDALDWESERTNNGLDARAWLRSKANSIEGGTNEIQLDILAKRVLNLPRG